MKKFSKISNFKVNSEVTHSEINVNSDTNDIKYSIRRLMEEFLITAIYGPIDPILEGTITIEGKDEFINALMDFLKQEDIKEQIKLLESAKYNGLDNTLMNLSNRLNEAQTPSEKSKHRKRIKDLVERANGDIDKAKEEAKRQANRIENGEKAYYRSIAAENLIGEEEMNKKMLKKIAEIFLFRSQQLGYRK